MDQNLINTLESQIRHYAGNAVRYVNSRPLSGGCINNGFEFITDGGSFFVKTNSASRYPGMFEAELLGLNLLRATETICLPKPVCAGASEDKAFLILEFVSSAPKSGDYWTDFGQRLAELHQQSNPFFGLDHDNYIGSLPQSNTQLASLTEFMITQRFEPLVRQSREQGLVEKGLVLQFEKLYHRLEHLIPDEKPALLHGDLWSGNVMTAHDGAVCLIDPAVFYGHREAELAFTTLFGAFPQEFYEAYHFSFPLEQDWQQRIDLWNIYPLLVHLLLFGSSYYSQISSIVRKYI